MNMAPVVISQGKKEMIDQPVAEGPLFSDLNSLKT